MILGLSQWLQSEREARVALALVPGVGAKRFMAVVERFESVQHFLSQSTVALRSSGALTDKQCSAMDDAWQQRVEQHWQWHQPDMGQHLLVQGEADYPPLLLELPDPPPFLMVRGQASLLSDPQIAMVGARHASTTGAKTAQDFARHFTAQGLVVTSGLAQGIDGSAHDGALQQGDTIAVMGTGIDRIYPASHHALAQRIVQQGALVSEFPLGTAPTTGNFPKRNRIISGLSLGTLVVEAAVNSGSLITARMALEQGRDVFAIPGSIHNPMAKGCHQLIKQGAKLVETGDDVLLELAPKLNQCLAQLTQSAPNETVLTPQADTPDADDPHLRLVPYDPTPLETLMTLCDLPMHELQAKVVMWQLQGHISQSASGAVQRTGHAAPPTNTP